MAVRYQLERWNALRRRVDGGRIEIDSIAAERVLRTVALGHKNYLFAGSDAGDERAAANYSLIGTAKLNGLDPEGDVRDVRSRIAETSDQSTSSNALPWRSKNTAVPAFPSLLLPEGSLLGVGIAWVRNQTVVKGHL